MISHQTPALFPLITQPPTPLLLRISHTVFCLNPAKIVSFPHNPTSPDLPGSVWITSHQLSAQAISARNVFECLVTSARGSRPPNKDSPSAAEPLRSAEPDIISRLYLTPSVMPALSPHTQSNNSNVYGLPVPGNPHDSYVTSIQWLPHGHPPQLPPNLQPLAQTVKSSPTPTLTLSAKSVSSHKADSDVIQRTAS
ncbi:hypothetical protein E4T56_gene8227 [Termitomyces sp. T112]|nr:hypothetical protein E4T56_gene8227 [Termitomyces sp. T112]